ncbi:hypothetical protein [uncultured Abiotrophia sp.]|uniref:hypothetical protein n=1 Tax=uncultured Abiotrophia sp. TaxID=316094 RepID=UPI0028D6F100|nr:hypothetical protein [uncultured Abiotrophia sp.]
MDEVKSLIEYYLALPQRIMKLEWALANISPRFYATNSFTGCGIQGNDADVQLSITPEYALAQILIDESIVSTRLERARLRWKLFVDEFIPSDLKRLRRELFAEYDISPFMMRAYDYIQEIEFYMKGHTLGVIPTDEANPTSLGDIEDMENELKELFKI